MICVIRFNNFKLFSAQHATILQRYWAWLKFLGSILSNKLAKKNFKQPCVMILEMLNILAFFLWQAL